jgi:hypothetical protein
MGPSLPYPIKSGARTRQSALQPFLVGSTRAMTDDDRRSFALIEISDLDAA